ncbi:AMP-binding protein [Rhodoferax sp. AJA081-3]|uniref:class I adenylate-forming enzyme family protein n=1 Tax=Rhodoferax sp. AJA081-3 TaxID=2752316 RepID=UPI001AE0B07D|nr:AMP-binding protein [Rhodoferax sp. AJA081-3]QTN29926.1 AMP-binding protein [Rhodoferax sp. AJA081-3]
MNIVQLLVRAARVHADRPAVLLGGALQLDYGQLAARASHLAAYLRQTLALQAGDRVAIYMTNHVAYLEILYAAWWAGLAVVPINAKLHPKELAFIVDDAKASVLFVTDDLADTLGPVLPDVPTLRKVLTPGQRDYDAALQTEPMAPVHRQPDDLAWLFYTSGTTGRPKGVMQTHRNLYAMTSCYLSDVDGVDAQDAMVYAAPMSHGAGMYNFAIVANAARHVVPVSGGFDAAELLDLAESVGRICMFAAPTMVKRLVEQVHAQKANVAGFKTIVYGGGPMYVEDIQRALATMGPRFVQIYGQGESPMTITALSREHLADSTHPQWGARIASVGVAQMLVEVRVVDEAGVDMPHGATGEIVVRGETVMAGYWNNPQATANALRDGWLWTGDMGSLNAQGFLTLKDRSKDVIISGGSNIYPREVEEVLLRHPGVREVSVIGQSDPEWGEVVVAFVVSQNVSSQDLDQLCLEHIARFKRPKHYIFVDNLPKNNYGKVLKTALRETLSQEK